MEMNGKLTQRYLYCEVLYTSQSVIGSSDCSSLIISQTLKVLEYKDTETASRQRFLWLVN